MLTSEAKLTEPSWMCALVTPSSVVMASVNTQTADVCCCSLTQWLLEHQLTGADEEVDTAAGDASMFAETAQ